MNKMLTKLIEWRRTVFKPAFIQIPNKEWLYMLKEETRNSLMIEGIFTDEDELDKVMSGTYKSGNEVVNYFRTAKFFYSLAFEYAKTQEKLQSLALVRTCHRMLFEGIIQNESKLGNFRYGPIKITGAKIKPPEYDVSDWVKLWLKYVEYAYQNHPVQEATARAHVLFESIHPFEDGNGRIGRILMNTFLIYFGYLNIVIKGVEDEERKEYIKALESAERGIRKLFEEDVQEQSLEKIDGMFSGKDTEALSNLIGYRLIEAFDRQICFVNKDKLVRADEFAKQIGKSTDAVRKMIERKQLIAIKPEGRWLVYPQMCPQSL
ncbi:Fic family protein [Pseudothermotoga sp. U03pept]|uniref:Fic family protein n=1 Tax=Pseudothermotoga sp. U03pept TaxID=3447012 RepID=UPI003F051EF2